MNLLDLLSLCAKNLLRRRTRSLLAIMGVLVGTCSVVLMLSIGFGLTASYEAQIESYGNLHMINMYYYGGNSFSSNSGREQGVLNDKSLEQISKMEGVTAVTPVISQSMTFGAGKYVMSTEVKGVDPEVFEKFNYSLKEGRTLASTDKLNVLFGSWVPQWFYDPQSRDYQEKEINVMREELVMTADWYYGQKESEVPKDKTEYELYEVKAIGVLEETNDNSDYCAYMNIKEMEKIQKATAKANKERVSNSSKNKTYEEALVYVENLDYIEDINTTLKDQGYQTSSPIDWLQAMKKTANMIQMVLGGIGGISLIVAALGITNTMIMSVYERTREIGVMKVIGANLKDIRKMFLLEAGMIGAAGGIVGVVLSLIISLLLNTVFFDAISMALGAIGGGGGTVISVIPPWLVLAAVAFATGIGVFAGYSPASRAMKMSALESLKNE